MSIIIMIILITFCRYILSFYLKKLVLLDIEILNNIVKASSISILVCIVFLVSCIFLFHFI